MPQMAPLNWIVLFLTFISLYILINIMNYYIFTKKISPSQKKSYKNFTLNWKW